MHGREAKTLRPIQKTPIRHLEDTQKDGASYWSGHLGLEVTQTQMKRREHLKDTQKDDGRSRSGLEDTETPRIQLELSLIHI